MRVLHIVPYFPPERLGGVGEFVARLHAALSEAGHESLVVTSGRRSTATVRRIALGPLGWFVKSALWARRAADFDVVHFQAGEALPLVLLLACRRRRPRMLATFHVSYRGMAAALRPYAVEGRTYATGLAPLVSRTLVAWLHRALDAATIALVDAVNTISRASAEDVLGPRRAAAAHVVYYGLGPLPGPIDGAGIEPVELLYAGAPGHRKRVSVLPEVLARVRREVPGARLRILGFDLADEPELAAQLADRDLTAAVECLGCKRSSELPPYYASAGALLVPSAYEGLPMVILEAMQCGLPAVATRVSGHPEAIEDGVNGYLVDLDRPDQMAGRCVRLLRDDALRRRLGAAARRTIAEKFGIERHREAYLALYEELGKEDARR